MPYVRRVWRSVPAYHPSSLFDDQFVIGGFPSNLIDLA